MPAICIAATQRAQGSQEVATVQPVRSSVPSLAQASRIASVSPWEVGSSLLRERLKPSPTISPARSTTAPKGSQPGVAAA